MRTALLVSRDLAWSLSLATEWAGAGDEVTVVLLDAAVSAVRRGHDSAGAVKKALAAGAVVAAEEQSLRARPVPTDERADRVKILNLDEVADLLVDGTDKVVWL